MLTKVESVGQGYLIEGPAYFTLADYHACGRKIRHDNLLSAIHHANRLRNKEGEKNSGCINVYVCRFCDGLHVGRSRERGMKNQLGDGQRIFVEK